MAGSKPYRRHRTFQLPRIGLSGLYTIKGGGKTYVGRGALGETDGAP